MNEETASQIFDLLREIKTDIARIDERLRVVVEQTGNHEERIKALELKDARRSGALAAIGTIGGAIGAAISWLVSHLFGG